MLPQNTLLHLSSSQPDPHPHSAPPLHSYETKLILRHLSTLGIHSRDTHCASISAGRLLDTDLGKILASDLTLANPQVSARNGPPEGPMSVPEEFAAWAAAKGVVLDGVEPRRIPGRGIGIVCTRAVEVSLLNSPLLSPWPSWPGRKRGHV